MYVFVRGCASIKCSPESSSPLTKMKNDLSKLNYTSVYWKLHIRIGLVAKTLCNKEENLKLMKYKINDLQ